ncbi:LPO_1073/Vpar_1526 family protein [Pseudomonas canadensis]|uniref:LPO_1073/Vpar_1526 family protein n=1 Tax=Pseudomonas canadensis TaxID=915099 RepID=UPI0030D138B5
MINSQDQKGGDSSTNIQARQIVMHVGIDEKRAREIYQEMNLQLRSEYSQEALNIANYRVAQFEDKLMPKITQVEGALEAFADPSFQLLLVEAQKSAASTERPADYDLLSELLIHRFQKGENRIARAGISLAVEIVDKVSDDALLGLTVRHALDSFLPSSGDIHQGLDVMNELFGKLFYRGLPVGQDWLDHLDILDAVRLNGFGTLKKVEQYYPEHLSGYIDVGIEKNSESYKKSIEILSGQKLSTNILVEHSFNSGYVRLCIPNKDSVDRLSSTIRVVQNGIPTSIQQDLSKEQKQAIHSVYELYTKDESIRQANVNLFLEEWDKRSSLKTLRKWWNNIPTAFTVTSVGKVLAHSNAQRCDKNLPPLD